MISSIVLFILTYKGIVDPDVSLGFWKWYFAAYGVEVFIYSKVFPKVLDWYDEVRK